MHNVYESWVCYPQSHPDLSSSRAVPTPLWWYLLVSDHGEFDKSRTIRQSYTYPNLYHKTVGINSATNEYRANSGEHAWLKLVTTKSTWTLFNPHYSLIATVYASSSWITRFSFTSYAPSLGALYSCHPKCYHLTTNAHTILVPHVMIK